MISAAGLFWMLHRTTAGTWSNIPVPGNGVIAQAALIPGTNSLWAAGTVAGATILAYGPIIRTADKP